MSNISTTEWLEMAMRDLSAAGHEMRASIPTILRSAGRLVNILEVCRMCFLTELLSFIQSHAKIQVIRISTEIESIASNNQ